MGFSFRDKMAPSTPLLTGEFQKSGGPCLRSGCSPCLCAGGLPGQPRSPTRLFSWLAEEPGWLVVYSTIAWRWEAKLPSLVFPPPGYPSIILHRPRNRQTTRKCWSCDLWSAVLVLLGPFLNPLPLYSRRNATAHIKFTGA